MDRSLPQVCITCRKLKVSSLGHFIKVKSKFNRHIWKCFACSDKEAEHPNRLARLQHRQSPCEREVCQGLKETGYKFDQDYPLGPFIFDFAFQALKLLIEVDGRSYHQGGYKMRRDYAKTAYATGRGWKVVRIPSGFKCAIRAERAVLDREHDFA